MPWPCPSLELENYDTVGRRRSIKRHGLVKSASDVFATTFGDGLLRWWEEIIFVAVCVFDGNFPDDIGRWRPSGVQCLHRCRTKSETANCHCKDELGVHDISSRLPIAPHVIVQELNKDMLLVA